MAHSFPTRRSSDLSGRPNPRQDRPEVALDLLHLSPNLALAAGEPCRRNWLASAARPPPLFQSSQGPDCLIVKVPGTQT